MVLIFKSVCQHNSTENNLKSDNIVFSMDFNYKKVFYHILRENRL